MDISVEDYTAKTIIVYGPGTLKIKDELRKLGSWKPLRLRKTPKEAWIIPKRHEAKVMSIIGAPKGHSKGDSKGHSREEILVCIAQTSEITQVEEEEVKDIVFQKYPQYQALVSARPKPKPTSKPRAKPKRRKTSKKQPTFKLPKKMLSLAQVEEAAQDYLQGIEEDVTPEYDGMEHWRGISYETRSVPGVKLNYKFRYNAKKKKLVIPEGVTRVYCAALKEYRSQFADDVPTDLRKIVCPSTLELLFCGANEDLEKIKFPAKRNNISYIDAHYTGLRSLNLSQTKIWHIHLGGCQSLRTLIMPPTGPKKIDIGWTALRALFVPPAVKEVTCEGSILVSVYLKENKQNQGKAYNLSKQEKMLADCARVPQHSQNMCNIRTGKCKKRIWYNQSDIDEKFKLYKKFPTVEEQKAIFHKLNPPKIPLLERLSDDDLAVMMEKLDFPQLVKFCKTSKRVFRICGDKSFQRNYVKLHFGKIPKEPGYYGYKSYFNLYKALLYRIKWKPVCFREWPSVWQNDLVAYYVGPDGVEYDEKTRTLIFPKGTIGIAPDASNFQNSMVRAIKLEEPKDLKMVIIGGSDTKFGILEGLLGAKPLRYSGSSSINFSPILKSGMGREDIEKKIEELGFESEYSSSFHPHEGASSTVSIKITNIWPGIKHFGRLGMYTGTVHRCRDADAQIIWPS